MTLISLGDLAQSLVLRRAVGDTQSALRAATEDLALGRASDPARHLGGHAYPLAAIDSSLSRNSSLSSSLAMATTRAEVMQASLEQIDLAATDAARALFSAAQSAVPATLRIAAGLSMEALETVVQSLNQRYSGQGVFSGTAGEAPALASAGTILATARTATATAASISELSAQLDTWMSSPDGYLATVALGNAEPVILPIGAGKTVSLSVTAIDPLLRSTLKGLLMGTLLAEDRFARDPAAQAEIARTAGETLYGSSEQRAELAARLGFAQSRIEEAKARVSAETSFLQIARNDLLSLDLYEVSARLSETETRLETLFAITARLSRLSLTDYIR